MNVKLMMTTLSAATLLTSFGASAEYSEARSASDLRGGESRYSLRASDLIGQNVVNADDDAIGEIDDLIIPRDGGAMQAILSVGGVLGIGDKLVAIPYEELRFGNEGQEVYYNSTEDDLLKLSEFSYNEGELFGRDVRRARNGALADLGIEPDREIVDWGRIDENWEQFKSAARNKYHELTDEDWVEIDGDHESILRFINERTGRDEQQVRDELRDLTRDM